VAGLFFFGSVWPDLCNNMHTKPHLQLKSDDGEKESEPLQWRTTTEGIESLFLV
jgi:hypothetical protein